MAILGNLLLLLGFIMCTRGWVYTLKPEGNIARKRQQKNMRLGFTTDMRVFGRKIRRFGLLIIIIGACSSWQFWHSLIENL